jgi:hypothetical protein
MLVELPIYLFLHTSSPGASGFVKASLDKSHPAGIERSFGALTLTSVCTCIEKQKKGMMSDSLNEGDLFLLTAGSIFPHGGYPPGAGKLLAILRLSGY